MEIRDRGCDEPEDSPVGQPVKKKGAEGHGLTDQVRVFGFHSPIVECLCVCVCGGLRGVLGWVIRVHIPSGRFLLYLEGSSGQFEQRERHLLQCQESEHVTCSNPHHSALEPWFVSECGGCISPSLKATRG